jgi:hypothetical protein
VHFRPDLVGFTGTSSTYPPPESRSAAPAAESGRAVLVDAEPATPTVDAAEEGGSLVTADRHV